MFGQIVATSAEVTPKGGLLRQSAAAVALRPSQKRWFIKGISPKYPLFMFGNFSNLPRYVYLQTIFGSLFPSILWICYCFCNF